MKMDKITIAIVDDHDIFRNGIETILSKEATFRIVLQEATGNVFLTRLDEMERGRLPKIVLTDVNMPFMSGFDILYWLQVNYPQIRVIAMSMDNSEMTILRMINSGVSAYLFKGLDAREIIAAVQLVATRRYYFDNLFGEGVEAKQSERVKMFRCMAKPERDLAMLLASDMTLNQICNHLNVPSDNMINRQREIFQYLNVSSRPQLAVFTRILTEGAKRLLQNFKEG